MRCSARASPERLGFRQPAMFTRGRGTHILRTSPWWLSERFEGVANVVTSFDVAAQRRGCPCRPPQQSFPPDFLHLRSYASPLDNLLRCTQGSWPCCPSTYLREQEQQRALYVITEWNPGRGRWLGLCRECFSAKLVVGPFPGACFAPRKLDVEAQPTVVAIGVGRGERGSDGGRIARPEPSREGESRTFGGPEAED